MSEIELAQMWVRVGPCAALAVVAHLDSREHPGVGERLGTSVTRASQQVTASRGVHGASTARMTSVGAGRAIGCWSTGPAFPAIRSPRNVRDYRPGGLRFPSITPARFSPGGNALARGGHSWRCADSGRIVCKVLESTPGVREPCNRGRTTGKRSGSDGRASSDDFRRTGRPGLGAHRRRRIRQAIPITRRVSSDAFIDAEHPDRGARRWVLRGVRRTRSPIISQGASSASKPWRTSRGRWRRWNHHGRMERARCRVHGNRRPRPVPLGDQRLEPIASVRDPENAARIAVESGARGRGRGISRVGTKSLPLLRNHRTIPSRFGCGRRGVAHGARRYHNPTMSPVDGRVAQGAAALARGEWTGAREHFEASLDLGEETTAALEGLSDALFWLRDWPSIERRTRAFMLYQAANDACRAARAALWLAMSYFSALGNVAAGMAGCNAPNGCWRTRGPVPSAAGSCSCGAR